MSNWNKEINDGGGKGIPMYTDRCKCGRECSVRMIEVLVRDNVTLKTFGEVGTAKYNKETKQLESMTLHAGNDTFVRWLEPCADCYVKHFTNYEPPEFNGEDRSDWRSKDWLDALHISAAKPSAKERQRQESIDRQKRLDER